MAFVLPPPSPSSLRAPFTESFCMRSRSSVGSDTDTVRRHFVRSPSPASFLTVSSLPAVVLSSRKENSPLIPSSCSLLNLNLFDGFSGVSVPRRSRSCNAPGDDWESTRLLLHDSVENSRIKEPDAVLHVVNTSTEGVVPPCPIISLPEDADLSEEDLDCTSGESTQDSWPIGLDAPPDEVQGQGEQTSEQLRGGTSPFSRWLNTLRKRNTQRSSTLQVSGERWILDDFDLPPRTPRRQSGLQSSHRKTPSTVSSLAFITAVKSASVTLASLSIHPKSRLSMQTIRYRDNQPRGSIDSVIASTTTAIDDSTWARSVQRRRIVEEIVSSEESYIRDMKTLINVYFTVLPADGRDHRAIHRSLTQILNLHEELLYQLQRMLASAEPSREKAGRPLRTESTHIRWRSSGSAPSRSPLKARLARLARHSIDTSRPSLIQPRMPIADTKLALNLTKIFDKFIPRFLTYEAYASHDSLIEECSSTLKSSLTWSDTERGIEALSSLTIAVESREIDFKKALTLSDLLIKPIQRILKYPLFFSDLRKQTPSIDDPVANAEINKVLLRLNETAEEINRAKGNPEVRKRIQTTWLLQDRLEFDDKDLPKSTILHNLGHVLLCGVLHVTFATSDRVKGQYMIGMLYRSALVLAVVSKQPSTYRVCAVIPLLSISIEPPDNGRGLQCYTAQFTWKLVFDINQRQYEIILSACSEMEEQIWKTQLRTRIFAEAAGQAEGRINPVEDFSLVFQEVKSIGPSFVPFTNFSRRRSIHRAATLGPKSSTNQVIIKNTEAQKYVNDSSTSFSVVRSQSHMSSGHVLTLAPRRTERIRLENALVDVWTADVLPYPGMGSRRIENPIRASANSVMRKLSMASIASNFSKRSTSHTSLGVHRFDEGYTSSSGQSLKTVRAKKPVEKRRRPVDFHTTPSAFLPEDFGLNLKPDRRARKLQNRLSSMNGAVSKPQPVGQNRSNSENNAQKHKYLDMQSLAQSAAAAFGFDGAADGAASSRSSLADRSPNTAYVRELRTSLHLESSKKPALKPRNRLLRFFG